jgi:hypothetical protein
MKHHSIIDIENLLEFIELESSTKALDRSLPSPKISIYFSMRHASDYAIVGKAELKGLIQKATRKMVALGTAQKTRLKIESSLETLLHNDSLWMHRSDGCVIFASANVLHYFVVPWMSDHPSFASIASVGDEFDIRPLVPLLSYPEHFYALEVALGGVHLMRVMPDLVVPMKLDCPSSLEAFRSENTPVANRNFHTARLDQRPSGGIHSGANRGIVVPHGSSQDEKHNEIDRYAALIARSVDRMLARIDNPLVVTGAKDLVRHFLRHLKHHNTMVSMDDLQLPETDLSLPADNGEAKPLGHGQTVNRGQSIWQRCAKLYEESYAAREQQTALLAYRAFEGTGRTSHDLVEIEQLAQTGQISTLIVSEADDRFGSGDASSCGLLNKAIIATLRCHGDVVEAAHHGWLKDLQTAAILRPGAMLASGSVDRLRSNDRSGTFDFPASADASKQYSARNDRSYNQLV